MADYTVRRRDESWIEVVVSTPTCSGELAKAHQVMIGQICPPGVIPFDDAYAVTTSRGASSRSRGKKGQPMSEWAFKDMPTVGNWRRWLNIWRLRHSYDPGGVAVEFYRSRKGVVVTRVVQWRGQEGDRGD